MSSKRAKWKFFFVFIVCIFISEIYDSATVPDIISPTHPFTLSIYILIVDFMLLFGTYCYAFQKKYIQIKLIWFFVLLSVYISNIFVLGFEFYNRHDGYEIYDMVQIFIIKTFIVVVMSYPTYLYYTIDLFRKNSSDV